MAILMHTPVPIMEVGHIDTGVHAHLMITCLDWEEPIGDLVLLAEKLGRLLPKDIAVCETMLVIPEAHARFDATSRTCKYYITTKKDPFNHRLVYKLPGRLDFEAVNEMCKVLFDYIDFTSFSRLRTGVKTNNRHIRHAGWIQKGDIWVFTIRTDHFLRDTARTIVGTLLEAGRGRLTIDGSRNVVETKDHCKAGTFVPGHTLFLVGVMYPEEFFPVED